MASLEVERTTEPEEWESWNRALAEKGREALFSTTHWAETLASAQGCSWTLHLCKAGEQLMGGVILLDDGGGGKKRRFIEPVAPLFSIHLLLPDNLGPARRIPKGVAVLTALEKQLSSIHGALFLSTPPGLLDLRPFIWAGWRVTPEYAFVLPPQTDPHPSSTPPGARLDADVLPPDDLFARLVAERRYGTVCQVRPRGGLSFPVLAVRGEGIVAPLPIGNLPEGCSARDVIHTAVALGREGDGGNGMMVFVTGNEWAERLGDGDVAPLLPVVTGRIEKGRGGGG